MKARIVKILFASIVLLGLFLSSCIGTNPADTPGQPTNSLSIPLETRQTPTTTKTSQPVKTNIVLTPTFTVTPNPFSWLEIESTQATVLVSTESPADPKYLYKYAIVTVNTPWHDGENYLNLDDLSNNGVNNSDVYIGHGSGSMGTSFDLFPINGSYYYYTGLHSMSYDSCLAHYPFTKIDSTLYLNQSSRINTGRDFCVITSEGRLSIIRLFPESVDMGDSDFTTLEFVVTTYKEPVPLVLTPYPTDTPGPSPTPSRYSGLNLTVSQQLGLDRAAQKLINAVSSGDKNTVAEMIDYPVALGKSGAEYLIQIETKDEFIEMYDQVFTNQLVNDFSYAVVEQNMGLFGGYSLALILPDCAVFFYPDGRISEISVSNYWWDAKDEY